MQHLHGPDVLAVLSKQIITKTSMHGHITNYSKINNRRNLDDLPLDNNRISSDICADDYSIYYQNDSSTYEHMHTLAGPLLHSSHVSTPPATDQSKAFTAGKRNLCSIKYPLRQVSVQHKFHF